MPLYVAKRVEYIAGKIHGLRADANVMQMRNICLYYNTGICYVLYFCEYIS